MTTVYVLILTIVGSTSQSGMAISMQEFNSYETCMAARAEWLKQYPRDHSGKYYDNGSPRAICAKK